MPDLPHYTSNLHRGYNHIQNNLRNDLRLALLLQRTRKWTAHKRKKYRILQQQSLGRNICDYILSTSSGRHQQPQPSNPISTRITVALATNIHAYIICHTHPSSHPMPFNPASGLPFTDLCPSSLPPSIKSLFVYSSNSPPLSCPWQ
jgi:hypothetical protein